MTGVIISWQKDARQKEIKPWWKIWESVDE